ncbi:hypothetical protein L1787_05690 [Acuticoccus sp. M5D2P5]|uniref:hypothetical protein n=1 Tax=Acuticoccus kalidii TaxID=2910977 RepID=UPI001F36A83D|nr:hypothetical protein [Acuticoccus kalidii]MCF3932905.1 hypothetical protein [Acuticoccus kalidii]
MSEADGGAGASARLTIDAVREGRADGWAHGPEGTRLYLRVNGDPVASWPRTVARPDVDAAVGDTRSEETREAKGFAFPLGAVAGLLALTPSGRRPNAALTFGEARHAIAPGAPGRTLTTLGHAITDLWLADSRHLRLRTDGRLRRVILVQADQRVFRAEAVCPAREAIVTLRIADPMAPILLLLETDAGAEADLVPFPSLLRGGPHAAETLATAGGDEGLPGLSTTLSARLLARTHPRRLAPADDWSQTQALGDPLLKRFILEHGSLADDASALPALPLVKGEIPTLAALCGPASGTIAVDPSPGGETWLVASATNAALLDAMPRPSPVPLAPEALAAPATIATRIVRDEGLDPLLFPLPADTPFTEAAPFRLAILPGAEREDALLESLAGTPFERVDETAIVALAADTRPVLFADPAILFHDRRTIAALTRLAGVERVASAGAMLIAEPAEGQTSAHDRVRSAGLFPTHAAVDAPWRPSVGPVPVSRLLPRATYLVAANDPALVIVSQAGLAVGDGLDWTMDEALPQLLARASAGGLAHVATTWFSAFDRGASVRPGPAPAFTMPAAGPVSLVRRLV